MQLGGMCLCWWSGIRLLFWWPVGPRRENIDSRRRLSSRRRVGVCFEPSVGDVRAYGTYSSQNEVAEPAVFFFVKNPVGDGGEGSGRTSVTEGRFSDLRLRGVARRVVQRLQVSGKFSDNSRRPGSCTDEYQRLKLNASHSGVEVNDDALFLQAAGGVNSKGLVYGLGNQTQAYYESVGPSTQSSPSTPIAYAPSMYAQIVSRLQKSEEQLNATREELTRTKEGVKQTKDAIARIESRFGSSSS
ncbi:hypothetical protein Cgig2_028344 [Carnegiea gigantea]|uniref:Uncharacterized protein n=1 Tax=Carnegiea gigantea TaxID=171969 RepID=A0A9Q1KJ91_9CARY|nr:hypothetical protein Cgig2_028344 [Carnegiea gigantea]